MGVAIGGGQLITSDPMREANMKEIRLVNLIISLLLSGAGAPTQSRRPHRAAKDRQISSTFPTVFVHPLHLYFFQGPVRADNELGPDLAPSRSQPVIPCLPHHSEPALSVPSLSSYGDHISRH